MAISNHERVGKALELLRQGLRPFVERELKAYHGDHWASEVKEVLRDTRLGGGKSDAMLDVAVQLVIMDRSWGDVFRKMLGRAERSLVNELLDARNRWAHQNPFSGDDADRALDSVSRLRTAVSAPEADEVSKMKMELRRLIFDEQVRGENRTVAGNAIAEAAANPTKTRVKAVSNAMSEDQAITQADRIRQCALDHYVAPARAGGRSEITIRAGDVHQAMGLANAMPAVCSAIGGNKFEELAYVTLVKRSGPANGANVYFHFSLNASLLPKQPAISRRQPAPGLSRTGDDLDLASAIVLVSCVKSKLPHPAPARSLYTSTWFRKTRDLVEGSGARWFVLSSLYGLVAPNAEIAPYEYTLNTLGIAERRDWANKVLGKLLPEIVGEQRIVMFAGHRYCEFLVGPLWRHGISVELPMASLRRGEQLAWLSETE